MRLPIFIAAQPQIGLTSVRVTIGAGKWQLVKSDDEPGFEVYLNDALLPSPQSPIEVMGISKIFAIITRAGKRPFDLFIETMD